MRKENLFICNTRTTLDTVGAVTAALADGTVATSEMSIAKNTMISLSTTTAAAAIRYTTDGSCPCRDGALVYTTPIAIRQDTTLRAAAVKNGVFSEIAIFRLTIDAGTPSPGAGSGGGSGGSSGGSTDNPARLPAVWTMHRSLRMYKKAD